MVHTAMDFQTPIKLVGRENSVNGPSIITLDNM